MKLAAILTAPLLFVFFAACSWFGSAPVTGQDARDDDVIADWAEDPGSPDVPDVFDTTPDPDTIEDTGDLPVECTYDHECDDTEPCNGMERCEAGQCKDGEPLEDDTPCVSPFGLDGVCVDGLCIPFGCGDGVRDDGEECDDGNDVSGDGCEINCIYSCHESGDCDDLNACTDDACSEIPGGKICTHEPVNGPCDDGLFCTLTDMCSDDGECAGTGDTCDDGAACTIDMCREETDACDNSIAVGWCLIAEVCYMNGNDNPANACRRCISDLSNTSWSNKDPGSVCHDGYACTDNVCDDEGRCVITPDDDDCMSDGEICRPECFPDDPAGCGYAPSTLLLSCESPVIIPPVDEDVTADCRIVMDGYGGPTDCLECTGELGVKVLGYADFEGEGYDCDLDGWSLVSDEECCASMNGCEPEGCMDECCSSLSSACVSVEEEEDGWALGVGGEEEEACRGYEEFRIERAFDTSGMDNLTLCFHAAGGNMVSADAVIVFVKDDVRDWQQVYCLDRNTELDDLNEFSSYCVELPDWAAGNPNLEIKIAVHSDRGGEDYGMLLDNVSLRGWSSGCEPTTLSVFTEDFEDCPGEIDDGWHGWNVLSGNPECFDEEEMGCGRTVSAIAYDEEWIIEQTVDASSLDGNIEVCFSFGDYEEGDFLRVAINAGNGLRTVWLQDYNLSDEGECHNVCVNVSDVDPDANRNPALIIGFQLDAVRSLADPLYLLDDIEVRGAVYCDAAGAIDIGEITEMGDEGYYQFTVTDVTRNQMSPDIHCFWDDPPDPVEDWDSIDFNL